MSIQKTPDARDIRYLHLVTGRLSDISEGKIASSLGFGSPEALYRQLRSDGHPVCPVCGATYVEENHCEQSNKKRKRKARRGKGEASELPAAANAMALFKRELETLSNGADQLKERREYLKDERFVATYVHQDDPEFTERYGSGTLSDKQREEVHERYGWPPPGTPGFYLYPRTTTTLAGGLQYPPEPLTSLIGSYALSGAPLEPLIASLHPEPSPETVQRTERARENLKREAKRLATLVRGRNLRTGHTTGEISPREQRIAWWVQKWAREGYSNEQIRERLIELRRFLGNVDVREIERFRKMNVPDLGP